MSRSPRGRHRAPRTLNVGQLGRASAVALASGGLLASVAAGAQATPTTAPAAPAAPATPAPAPAAPAPATPVLTTPGVQPATPVLDRTLRWGSRGDDVSAVQELVGADVDGIFGPQTHGKVKDYQRANGLEVDGIVGPITTASLGLDGSGETASTETASTETASAEGGSTETRESDQASRSTERSAPAEQAPSGNSSGVLGVAAQYTGIPYVWGGTTPSGFDCSGYTGYMFKQVGISLPRTAAQQQAAATPVSNPQPGDLVFFGSPAYHVGIYAGDGQMYDSGTPGTVTSKRAVFSGVSGYGRVG